MSAPDEPDSPTRPDRQPMRDLLLAQALEACVDAERQLSGSSEEIIARQPAWARGELRRLVGLAGSLDAATSNACISEDFRSAARDRLMRRIGADRSGSSFGSRAGSTSGWAQPSIATSPPTVVVPRLAAVPPLARTVVARRKLPLVWRGVAGLVAAVLGIVATLTASANSLPGEPLYSVKQAQEDLEVRLARGDEARTQTLLRQADTRLVETARLLQLGRTGLIAETTRRYDDVVELATMTYVVTGNDEGPNTPTTLGVETTLNQQHDELETLLHSAPEQSQATLRQALAASERGRALVIEARPPERAEDSLQMAAVIPTSVIGIAMTTADERPTSIPTQEPTGAPTPSPVVVAAVATSASYMVPLVAQSAATKREAEADQTSASGSGSDDGDVQDDTSRASAPSSALIAPLAPVAPLAPAPAPARSSNGQDQGDAIQYANAARVAQTVVMLAVDDRDGGADLAVNSTTARAQTDGGRAPTAVATLPSRSAAVVASATAGVTAGHGTVADVAKAVVGDHGIAGLRAVGTQAAAVGRDTRATENRDTTGIGRAVANPAVPMPVAGVTIKSHQSPQPPTAAVTAHPNTADTSRRSDTSNKVDTSTQGGSSSRGDTARRDSSLAVGPPPNHAAIRSASGANH